MKSGIEENDPFISCEEIKKDIASLSKEEQMDIVHRYLLSFSSLNLPIFLIWATIWEKLMLYESDTLQLLKLYESDTLQPSKKLNDMDMYLDYFCTVEWLWNMVVKISIYFCTVEWASNMVVKISITINVWHSKALLSLASKMGSRKVNLICQKIKYFFFMLN